MGPTRLFVDRQDQYFDLIYLFQMIPICISRPIFVSINQLFSYFIWAQKQFWIACTTLLRPKYDGGLAVPDALYYYVASVAARIQDWFQVKLWVLLETALNKTPLNSLPWIPAILRPTSILPSAPFKAQTTYISHLMLFTPDGPLTPLVGNQALSLPALVPSLPLIPEDKPPVLHNLRTPSSIKSFEDIVEEPTPLGLGETAVSPTSPLLGHEQD